MASIGHDCAVEAGGDAAPPPAGPPGVPPEVMSPGWPLEQAAEPVTAGNSCQGKKLFSRRGGTVKARALAEEQLAQRKSQAAASFSLYRKGPD